MSAGPANRPPERPIALDARALHRRLHSAIAPAWVPDAAPSPDEDRAARRRELYVLLAVCLEEVVGDFVAAVPPEDVPPLRLAEGENLVTAAFCDLLLQTFGRFFESRGGAWRDSDRRPSTAPLLDRIDAIGPGASSVLDLPRPRYAEALMRAGMTTMAAVAPPVLSAAAGLAGSARVEEVAELALASVRVPARLAAVGLDEFGALQRALIDPETMEFRHADAVRLVEENAPPRLKLCELPDVAAAQNQWWVQPRETRRLGCPTLVRLGSRSAMERLWAWTVDAAQTSGYFAARLSRGAR